MTWHLINRTGLCFYVLIVMSDTTATTRKEYVNDSAYRNADVCLECNSKMKNYHFPFCLRRNTL